MAIVGGLDIHRRQITYDWIDTGTGETRRGQLSPATRLELRAWLTQFDGQPAGFALEATTGWQFVVEELERTGAAAHLAKPADAAPCAAPSGAPRPTAPTPATSAHRRRAHPGPAAPCAARWLDAAAGAAIAVGYLALSWAATGRSVGKQVAGLRVVGRVGRRLSLRRSLARAVLYVLFPAGLLWVLASRRNASVQDLVVGTAVVYDWAYHPADESPQRVTAAHPARRPHRRKGEGHGRLPSAAQTGWLGRG
jgi:uncharacterized RDD family membrane protein YckC